MLQKTDVRFGLWMVLAVLLGFGLIEPGEFLHAQGEQSITYGQTISDEIDDRYGDTWIFDGTAGDIITVAMNSDEFNTYLELYAVEGETLLIEDDDGGEGTDSIIDAYELPESGRYTLVAGGERRSDRGVYSLSLNIRASGRGDGALAHGDVVRGQVRTLDGEAWYFRGCTGDVITIIADSTEFDTYLEVFGPAAGVLLTEDNDSGSETNSLIDGVELSATGAYTIVVSGNSRPDVGPYDLELKAASQRYAVEEGAAPLRFGEAEQGAVTDFLGEFWSFTGCADDEVTISMASNDFDTFLELHSSGDTELLAADDNSGADTNSTIAGFLLPDSGAYTVVAAGSSRRDLGDYALLVTLGAGGEAVVEGSETTIVATEPITDGTSITLTAPITDGAAPPPITESEVVSMTPPSVTQPLASAAKAATSTIELTTTLTETTPPSLLPTPTQATPAETPAAPEALCTVLSAALNLRPGPGTNYNPPVRTLTNGDQMRALARNAAGTWIEVTVVDSTDRGWVSAGSSYVSCTEAINGLSLSASTATPTPTPRPPATIPPAGQATPSGRVTPKPTTPATSSDRPPVLTGFETWGAWKRGDEAWGTFTQSSAQVSSGKFAGKFEYRLPANEANNYIVYRQTFSIPTSPTLGDMNALDIQVYGDGSTNFLNAWVQDANNQLWQFTFGRVNHTGWRTMVAPLDVSLGWPNQAVGSASTAEPVYPLRFYALIVDGHSDKIAHEGVIYVDDLRGGILDSSASSGNAAASTPATSGSTTATEPGEAEEPTTETAPAAASLSGRIAYTLRNTGSGRLDTYVYDLANNSRTTHLPNMRQPDFSAGGHLVANGEGGGVDDLVRLGQDGGNERLISKHPEDAHPHWSPSGVSVVFDSSYHGDHRHRVYLLADAGSRGDGDWLEYSGREIFGRYPVYLSNWRIAYNGCNSWDGGGSCGIYAADSEGSLPVRVTDQPGDIPTDNLGSQVLFTSARGGNWDVYVVNWDGSGLRRLTNSPARDGLATASPDGRHIAFVSDRDGEWAVYVMEPGGGDQRKLFDLQGEYGGGDQDWIQERISWGP